MNKPRRRFVLWAVMGFVPLRASAGVIKRRRSDEQVFAPTSMSVASAPRANITVSPPAFGYASPMDEPIVVRRKSSSVGKLAEPTLAVDVTPHDTVGADPEEVIRFDHTRK